MERMGWQEELLWRSGGVGGTDPRKMANLPVRISKISCFFARPNIPRIEKRNLPRRDI